MKGKQVEYQLDEFTIYLIKQVERCRVTLLNRKDWSMS